MPGSLTLRPSRQKEFYLNRIRSFAPELLPLYQQLYAKELSSGNPSYQYRQSFINECGTLVENVPHWPPHHVYKDTMPIYHEVGILLCHMTELYKVRGYDVSRLSEALDSYHSWAESAKKRFNRQRSLHHDAIDEELCFMLRCGGFEEVVQNEKLRRFISDVALERRVFNYLSLKFEE